jgi:hypothetical protein
VIQELAGREYRYGFVTDVEQDVAPRGLNEDIVRLISSKKNEPAWLLDWRLKAYRIWLTMKEPTWGNLKYGPIDYQNMIYYAAPKRPVSLQSLDEIDPEIRRTFDKLGIPLDEQKLLSGVAVDAVFDSVSVATTFKEKLASVGIIFCSFSEEYSSILSSSASTSGPWFPTPTISSRRSTRQSSATVRSRTSPRASDARWSFRPTSGSMHARPVSSSGR